MRRVRWVVVAVALLVGMVVVITGAGRKEKASGEVLNVLNWTSYIPDEIVREFEKESGIKVNYGTYSSNEELLAKVSSASAGTYDLIFPSDYMVELMVMRGMLESLDSSELKNYKNLDERFLGQSYDEENNYSLPFLLATTVFAYDSSKVERLTSYKDLLREELENDVVLLDDQRIVIGAFLNGLGHEMNDTNENHLNEVYEFYQKLKPNVKAFDSDSPKTFFITGEAVAGLVWNAEAILAQEENKNIKISYPAEGFALSMDNYCIVKGAKNVENAYKFIDYLLRDEVAEKIVEEYPYISPNKYAREMEDEELEEVLRRGSYVKNVGADIKSFDNLWARLK